MKVLLVGAFGLLCGWLIVDTVYRTLVRSLDQTAEVLKVR